MNKKVVVAIGGSSGAIYAKVLLDKLTLAKSDIDTVAIVMATMPNSTGSMNWVIPDSKIMALKSMKKKILWRPLLPVLPDSIP